MDRTQVLEIIAVNAFAWLVIQMGFAWLGTKLPISVFASADGYFRERPFEESGRFYDRVFGVRKWKDFLPDGSRWFRGGFPKGHLAGAGSDYLSVFIRETRRGEAVHGAVILSSALFFIWNPPGIAVWMVVYAVVSNLPCILVQRYNRIRMQRVLEHRRRNGPQPRIRLTHLNACH